MERSTETPIQPIRTQIEETVMNPIVNDKQQAQDTTPATPVPQSEAPTTGDPCCTVPPGGGDPGPGGPTG
jgi:hypothetical protein